jgi:GNAT superfamily N-acetyltransferase
VGQRPEGNQSFERLGPDAIGRIVALLDRALPTERLTAEEVTKALFGDRQPAVVRGHPDVGIVATVRGVGDGGARHGSVRLLAVAPDHRRKGNGRQLLAAAEADLDGVTSITIGADAPFFLFPGVPVEQIGMLTLLEQAKYQRVEANFNMRVALDTHDGVGFVDPRSPVARTPSGSERWSSRTTRTGPTRSCAPSPRARWSSRTTTRARSSASALSR